MSVQKGKKNVLSISHKVKGFITSKKSIEKIKIMFFKNATHKQFYWKSYLNLYKAEDSYCNLN